MQRDFLKKLIERRKQQIRRRKVVPKKWLYPISQERQYHKKLNHLVLVLKDMIKRYLLPEVPGMINEVNRKIPNDRADDFLDRLHSIILFIRDSMQETVQETIKGAGVTAIQIDRFNSLQFDKLKEQAFGGVNPFVSEPWLADQLKIFSAQNAELIQSLPNQELERVTGIIERGLQEGTPYKDVASQIQKSFGISKRKATLIARDQTKKLNSSLTKLRQTEIGVEEYVWQTSADERVRATHRANEGKTFRWDTPPKITGHPGNDVNCRCVAIAVLDKILDVS